MKIKIRKCINKEYKDVRFGDRKGTFDFHLHQNNVELQVSPNRKEREYRDWNLALIFKYSLYFFNLGENSISFYSLFKDF